MHMYEYMFVEFGTSVYDQVPGKEDGEDAV